jgi:hypothetical protein
MDVNQTMEQSVPDLRRQVESRHGPETEITREHAKEFIAEKIEKQKSEHKNWPAPAAEIPSYDQADIKPKVEELALMAEKNLQQAINQAVETHNPEIVDAFHALISDKLFDHLVETKQLDKLST